MFTPYSLSVLVNKVPQTLGNEIPVINNAQIPKLTPKMVIITNDSGFKQPNSPACHIEITWRRYAGFSYTDMGFVLFVAKRCHIGDAIKTLKIEPLKDTVESIKSKFQSHDDSIDHGLSISELKCKLTCPLSLCKLKEMPVKFKGCAHIECFDINVYLQMNYKRPTSWKCPICQREAPWESLRINTWMKNVSAETDDETKEVYLTKTGSWKLPSPKKEVKSLEEDSSRLPKKEIEACTLDSDDEGECHTKSKKAIETICILSSDDDDDDEEEEEIVTPEVNEQAAGEEEVTQEVVDPWEDILNDIKETERKSKEEERLKQSKPASKSPKNRPETPISITSSGSDNVEVGNQTTTYEDTRKSLTFGNNLLASSSHQTITTLTNNLLHSGDHPPIHQENLFAKYVSDASGASQLFNMKPDMNMLNQSWTARNINAANMSVPINGFDFKG